MEEDTYNEVWQVWQKEKQSTKLQQVPKSFYSDIFKHIDDLPTESEAGRTSKENLKRLLNNIYERRKQKLLIYLAYNQTPPQPLPPEEERLYSRLGSIVSSERLDRGEDKPKLVALQNVPKIVLPSGREVGPLEKDAAVSVEDEHDRNFLLNNSICAAV